MSRLFFDIVPTVPPKLVQHSINFTRKDIECATQNAVTFEWMPPTNMNETQLSHYEVVVTKGTDDVVKEINITNNSSVFILEDGNYTTSVTAVNKCGEKSNTVTKKIVIKNSMCAENRAGSIRGIIITLVLPLVLPLILS